MNGRVLFGGSRRLGVEAWPLVRDVVGSVARAGRELASGCCAGADVMALRAALVGRAVSRPVVFCIWGADGSGLGGVRPAERLEFFRSPGLDVRWESGGPVSLPGGARLAVRTRRAVEWCAEGGSGSAVVLFSDLSGNGSRLAVHSAVRLGVSVYVFSGGRVPVYSGVDWVCAGGGVWSQGLRLVQRCKQMVMC